MHYKGLRFWETIVSRGSNHMLPRPTFTAVQKHLSSTIRRNWAEGPISPSTPAACEMSRKTNCERDCRRHDSTMCHHKHLHWSDNLSARWSSVTHVRVMSQDLGMHAQPSSLMSFRYINVVTRWSATYPWTIGILHSIAYASERMTTLRSQFWAFSTLSKRSHWWRERPASTASFYALTKTGSHYDASRAELFCRWCNQAVRLVASKPHQSHVLTT